MVKGKGASPQFSDFQPKTDNLVVGGLHRIIGQTASAIIEWRKNLKFMRNLLIFSVLRGLNPIIICVNLFVLLGE